MISTNPVSEQFLFFNVFSCIPPLALTVLLPKISIRSLPSRRVPWQLGVGQQHVHSSHPGRFGHRSPASHWPNSSAFVLLPAGLPILCSQRGPGVTWNNKGIGNLLATSGSASALRRGSGGQLAGSRSGAGSCCGSSGRSMPSPGSRDRPRSPGLPPASLPLPVRSKHRCGTEDAHAPVPGYP